MAHWPHFTAVEITADMVAESRDAAGARRLSFTATRANQPKRRDDNYVGTLHLPAGNSAEALFKASTGLDLWQDKVHPTERWRAIQSEAEFARIEAWVRHQGTRVFLRDCLDLSVALDLNFVADDDGAPDHTPIGALEHRAKSTPDGAAIEALVDRFCATINDLPYYADTKLIAAVPPRPEKTYDLPTTLAERIASRMNLDNITPRFRFTGVKKSVKDLPLAQKWQAWEDAGLSLVPALQHEPSVILIDDKYQSGSTLQFVASRLRAAGAGPIFGLCAVKTWRDTDNA
jgi:hypothetical protein